MNKVFIVVFLILSLFGQFVQAQRTIEFEDSKVYTPSAQTPAEVSIPISSVLGTVTDWNGYYSTGSNNILTLSVLVDFVATDPNNPQTTGTISFNGNSKNCTIPASKPSYSFGTSFPFGLTSAPSALAISFNGFQSFNISKVTYKINGVVYKFVDSNLDPFSFVSNVSLNNPIDLYSFFDLKKAQLSSLSSFDGLEVQWFYKELPGYELNKSIMELDIRYLYSDSVYFDNQFFSVSNSTVYSFPVAKSGSALVYRLRGFVKRIGEETKYSSWLYSGVLNNDIYSLKNTCFTSIIGSLDGKTIPSMAIDFSDRSGKKYLFSFKDGNGKLLQSGLLQNLSSNPSSDLIISTPIYDVFDREIGQVMPFVVRKSSFNFIPDLNKLPNDAGYFSSKSTNVNGSDFCALPDFKFYSEIGNDGSMSYYSNNNSLLSASTNYPNFNYTPSDAGTDGAGRPFTLSTFTNDKTGRKRMDFAPGNVFGNQDRSTRYFYSAVFQEELDKYLGSDAGYARFYSKVVTKDPNNLYTLAIKDAKGQVVLSGISGTGENSPYIELDNNIPNSTNTVTLMNGFGKSELPYTQSLVNSQSLLAVPFTFVNPQSGLKINYEIDSKPFSFTFCSSTEPKCYSCEYEFELLMRDECNTEPKLFLPTGPILISNSTTVGENNVCTGGSNPYSNEFSPINSLSRGSYTIEKKLTLTEQSIKNAEAQFLSKQFNTCADINSTAGFESECDDSPIPTPNDPTFAESALLTSFLSDVSPGGQYGTTRSNYKTTQFDKDKKDIQVFNDPYLSVFNQGFRYTVNEGKTDIVFQTTRHKDNFKLPYQSIKGIFNTTNSWRDNFVNFPNDASVVDLNLYEFWRFPDYFGVLLGPLVNGVRDPISRPSTELGGNNTNFSPSIALTNTRIAFDKYYNYLDANGELVTTPVEFIFVENNANILTDNKWVCSDLINLGNDANQRDFYLSLFDLPDPTIENVSRNSIRKDVPIKYLKDVNVFLTYWHPSFARSLVKYHPEYHRVYLDPILGILDEKILKLNESNSDPSASSLTINDLDTPNPFISVGSSGLRISPSLANSSNTNFSTGFGIGIFNSINTEDLFTSINSSCSLVLDPASQPSLLNFIKKYQKTRYLDESVSPSTLEDLYVWEVFYKYIGVKNNFCLDVPAPYLGNSSDIINNYDLLKAMYIKQLLTLKNDLYTLYSKKSGSLTLSCFKSSDNFRLNVNTNSTGCTYPDVRKRVEGTEELYSKLSIRGRSDLAILDDEFKDIVGCSSPDISEFVPAQGSGSSSYFDELVEEQARKTDVYCSSYLNELIEKIEFRTDVAYYKNCGQCPEVKELETFMNFMAFNKAGATVSCNQLGVLSRGAIAKLKARFSSIAALIPQLTFADGGKEVQYLLNSAPNQSPTITTFLKFKLKDPDVGYIIGDLLQKHKISEFCCFKFNPLAYDDNKFGFSAKIRIEIDSSDPYFVISDEENLEPQYRYLDIIGHTDLFQLNKCDLIDCEPSSVNNLKLFNYVNYFLISRQSNPFPSGIPIGEILSYFEQNNISGFPSSILRAIFENLKSESIDPSITWQTFLKDYSLLDEVVNNDVKTLRILNNVRFGSCIDITAPINCLDILFEVRTRSLKNFYPDGFLVPIEKKCCSKNYCQIFELSGFNYANGVYFCSNEFNTNPNPCSKGLNTYNTCSETNYCDDYYYFVAGETCEDCQKMRKANIDFGVNQYSSFESSDDGSTEFTSFPAYATSLEDIINHSNTEFLYRDNYLASVKATFEHIFQNDLGIFEPFFSQGFSFEGFIDFAVQNYEGTQRRLFIEPSDVYKIRSETRNIALLSLNYQNGLKSHFIAKIKNGSDFYDLKFILSEKVSIENQELFQADRGSLVNSSCGLECSGTSENFKTASCTFNAININLFAKEQALKGDFERNSLYLFEYPIKDVDGKVSYYLRLPSLAYRWSDLVSFEVIESVDQMQFYFNVADASTYIPVIGRFKREFQNSSRDAQPILVEQVFFIRVPYEVEGLCVKRFIQSTGLCCPEDIRLPLKKFEPTDLACSTINAEADEIAKAIVERQNREAALLVFKEQYIKHCMSQKEKLTMTYSDRLYQTTLYYYDQSGNLVRTVAPQGVKEVELAENQEKIDEDRESGVKSVYTKHDYLSTYKFNSIQKQTSESNPDQDRLNLVDYASTSNSPKFVISNSDPKSVIKYINDRFIVSYDNNSGSGSAVHLSKNAGNTWSKLVLDEPKSYTGCVKIGVAENYLVFGKNGFLGEFNPSGSNNTVTPISTDIGDVNFVSGYVLELESSPATGYKILLTDDLGSRYLLTKTGTNSGTDPVFTIEVLGEEFAVGNKAKIDQLEELNFNLNTTQKSNLSALVQDNNLSIAVTDEFGTENKILDHGTLGSTIGITNVELDENNRPIVYTNRGGIYCYNSLESDFVRNENYEQDKEVFAIRRLDAFNEFVFYKSVNSFEVKLRKTTIRRLRSNTEAFRIPFQASLSLLGELKSLITVSDGSSSKLYSYSILTNSISGQPQNSYSLVRYSFDKNLENSETSSPAVSLINIDLPSSLSIEKLKVVPLKDGSCLLYSINDDDRYFYDFITSSDFEPTGQPLPVVEFNPVQVSIPAISPATEPSLYNAKIEASTVIGNRLNSKVFLLLSYTGSSGKVFRLATISIDGSFTIEETDLTYQNTTTLFTTSTNRILLKPTDDINKLSIHYTNDYNVFNSNVITIGSGTISTSLITTITGLNLTGSNKSFLVDDFGSVLTYSTDKKEVKYYNGFQIQVNQATVPTLNAKDLSARFRFNKVNSVSLSKVIDGEVDANGNPIGPRDINGIASANNGYFGIFINTQSPGVTDNLVNKLMSTTLTIERINNLTTVQTYKVGNVERASTTEPWNLTFFTDKSINRVIYNSTGPSPSAHGTIHPIADILNELGTRSLNKLVYKSGFDYLFSTNYGGLLKYSESSSPDQVVISSKANQDSKYQFIIPTTISGGTKLFAFGDNDFRAIPNSSNPYDLKELSTGDFNVKMADIASSPSGSVAVLLEVVNSNNARICWSRNNGLQWETNTLKSLPFTNGTVGKIIVNDDFSAEVVYPTKIIRIANITANPLITFEVPFNLAGSSAIPEVSKVFKYDNNRYIIISNSKINFLTNSGVTASVISRTITEGSSTLAIVDASMPTRNSLFVNTGSKLSKFKISDFTNPTEIYSKNLPTNHTGVSCRFVDDNLGYILASSDNQSVVLRTADGGGTFTVLEKSSTNSINAALDNNPGKCFDLNGDENLIVRANKVNGSTSEAHILSIKDQSDRITARFFYDEVGRLILSQNAKQYDKDGHLPRFSYMHYDALGRVTESGQIQFASTRPNGGFPSQDAMRTSIISDAEVAELFKENAGDIKEYVVQTYYDQNADAIDNTLGLPEFDQNNLQNRVSLVISEQKFAQTDKTFTSYTRYSYDVVGNVNKVDICYKYNLPGLASNFTIHNTIDYVFDELNGKVYSLSFNKGLQGQFYHQYKYDAQGRLQAVQTSVDGKVWVNDAKYYYYPHGPLARVELGHNNVQGLDYYYTLQGWLKGVNSSILNPKNDPGKDGFGSSPFAPDVVGYTLNYYNGDFTPIGAIPASERADLQGVSSLNNTVTTTVGSNTVTTVDGFRSLYNGNIAAMVTAHQGKTAPDARLGIYQYDELNRIKKTQNKILTASLFNNTETASLGTAPWSGNAPYNETFSYDKNGNIEALTRNDEKGAVMDNLDYDYLKMNGSLSMSNRLGKVKDAASAKPGFADFEGNPTTDVYEYDPSGNLKKDGLEGLERIVWTPANKMEFIEKVNNDGKRYYYYKVFDGTGQLALKWTTEKTTSGETAKDGEAYTRDPQGNTLATYKISNTGALTLTEQPIYGAARIGIYSPNLVIAAETPNPLVPEVYPIYGNRSYEISNHLGNVLAVVSDQKDANGKAVIIDKQDYYAFGSPLPKYENIKDETLIEINGNTTTLATQIFTGSGTTSNPVAVVSSTRTFQTPLVELQAGYYTYTGELAGCATLPNVINYGFNSEANATQVCTLVGNKFTIAFTASEEQRKLFIKVPVSEGCSGAVQLRALKLTRLQGKTVYQNNFTQPAVNWTYNGGALNVCTTSCTTSVGSIPYRGILIEKNKLLVKRLEGLALNQDYVARIAVKNLPTIPDGTGISILVSDANGDFLETDRKVVGVTNETLIIEVAFRATNAVHQFIYSTSSDFYTIVTSFTLERRKAYTKPTTASFTNATATNSILTCAGCAYSQQVGDVKVNTLNSDVIQFNHILTPGATYNLKFDISWIDSEPTCTSRTLEISTNGGITYTPVAIESGLNTTANINFTVPATISYPVLLRFGCFKVILANINYTVLRSSELVNDNFRTPDVADINNLGYQYFNGTNTTPSTADLSKETVVVGSEQFKILQITPSTPTTRLQKVLSGLEIGKTYRVAVILPRTTYNVTHEGTTYPVQNLRLDGNTLQLVSQGLGVFNVEGSFPAAMPGYVLPPTTKVGRGLTPDGNYHYWISFVATAPTATVTYLAPTNNIFPTPISGGFRLKNAGGRQIIGFTLHQKIPTEEDGESDGYRYGFNGQPIDNDFYGRGNLISFTERNIDLRLGRWISIDGKKSWYPNLSPYAYIANSPFLFKEVDGHIFGTLICGAIKGIQAYRAGKSTAEIIRETGKGMLVGLTADLTVAAVMATGGAATPLLIVAAGSAAGLTSNLVDQTLDDRPGISKKELAVSTVLGGVGGFVAHKFAPSIAGFLAKLKGRTPKTDVFPTAFRKSTSSITAEAANEADLIANPNNKPSYMPGTIVLEQELSATEQFVRVFSEGNTKPVGRWCMKAADIEGLTPNQIKDKFALEFLPTHKVNVSLPAGTKVETSTAGAIPEWGGNGGGEQTLILGKTLPENFFGEITKLK